MFKDKTVSLHSALDAVPDAIIILDHECKIIFSNAVASAILKTEFKNLPVDFFKEAGLLAFSGEAVNNFQLFVKESMVISCNARPMYEDQSISNVIISFRDVSELIKREREITKERSFYGQLLDFMPAIIYSRGIDGKYIFTNRSFKSFNPNKDPINWTPFDLFDSNFATRIVQDDSIVQQAMMPIEFEDIRNVDGITRHYRTVRFPMFDYSKELYAVSGITWDITDKVNEKKCKDEERAKLEHASKMASLGMLAAEIGHEVNNPLAIILSSSHILKMILASQHPSKELMLERILDIDKTVDRILHIVNALRNVSRDAAAEEFSIFTLKDVLNDVLSLSSVKIKTKNITLDLNMSHSLLSIPITSMRIQISEVFLNILCNAIDAVEGQKEKHIKVDMALKGDHAYFRITDSGPGVPEEMRDKIFKPFVSTKAIGKGTGLGLSISKNIMNKFNGDLYLEPDISPSCFTVKIPMN